MVAKLWSSMILFICGVLFTAMAHANIETLGDIKWLQSFGQA